MAQHINLLYVVLAVVYNSPANTRYSKQKLKNHKIKFSDIHRLLDIDSRFMRGIDDFQPRLWPARSSARRFAAGPSVAPPCESWR
jgi:hypothetical protein